MPKVGVLLSGCGVMDGTEISEAILALLALDREGAEAVCMAPDMDQREVVNHITQEQVKEKRNVLMESARISRGNITDVKKVSVRDLDALIMPGGWGAAKNLCSYVYDGIECDVHPEVERLVKDMRAARKPIGVICIAPALLSRILEGNPRVKLTIGNEAGAVKKIEAMGAEHIDCPVEKAVVDREHKIVSTPAFMLAKRISEAEKGISRLVREVLQLIEIPLGAKK